MKMGNIEKLIVNSTHHERRLVKWAEDVLHYIPLQAGQSILDVGCGTGALTVHLASHYGLYATGIDVDIEQIEEARMKTNHLRNINFLVNDARHLHLTDTTFDTVVTFKAMHHIADWQTAITEQVRVLKSGGYFALFDFVSPAWLSGLKIKDFSTITETALLEIITQNQLTVIHKKRSGLFYHLVCQKA